MSESSSNIQTIKNYNPRVACIAAGGCGINISRLLNLNDTFTKNDIYKIDSSTANLNNNNENVIVISQEKKYGSGKVRSTNSDLINKRLETLDPNKLNIDNYDIYILLYSLSGGSGSVIAPLFNRVLMRKNKAVVNFCVVDFSSGLDCTNAYKTLLSLKHITDQSNGYLPISVFSNEKTRLVADKILSLKLNKLIRILTSNTQEVDMQDKINFLSNISNSSPGLKSLYVYDSEISNGEFKDVEYWNEKADIYNSAITIGFINDDGIVKNNSIEEETSVKVLYTGYLRDGVKDAMTSIVASSDESLKSLIDKLQQEERRFASYSAESKEDIIPDSKSSAEANGLIL